MSFAFDDPRSAALLVAANRGIVYGMLSRWLLHELRTPTQALSLAGDLIARNTGPLADPVRQALSSHARHIRPLLDLLSRAQANPIAHEAQPTPLGDTVELLVAAQRGRPGTVTLDAAGMVAAGLPAVRANGPTLTHAILNVVMNSFDALDRQQVGTVTLVARVVRGGEAVEVTIDDDGPGVAPTMRERLFEPFATTKNEVVAGLGLAVARHLVGQWGGTLTYDSTRPSGTRFVMTLEAWKRA